MKPPSNCPALIAFVVVLYAAITTGGEPQTTPPDRRYRLTNVSVIDGDTLEGDINLPLQITLRKERVRLLGVDTWEITGKERERGKVARSYTQTAVRSGSVWIALSGKRERDNFGRILATVYINERGGKWRNLSAELIQHNHGTKRGE